MILGVPKELAIRRLKKYHRLKNNLKVRLEIMIKLDRKYMALESLRSWADTVESRQWRETQ